MAEVEVVILGAGGMVGAGLADKLRATKTLKVQDVVLFVGEVILVDMKDMTNTLPVEVLNDKRFVQKIGNLSDSSFLNDIFSFTSGRKHWVIFHLAALLSGYAEDNFDLGLEVNLYCPIQVMQRVRQLSSIIGTPQVYLFVSTDYVLAFNEYNRTHPCTEESFRLSPVSYGIQKSCIENLLCDFTRKGFLDGRVARLSGVLGRPGWSNSISFPWTGIFTQTLGKKPGVDSPYQISLPLDSVLPISPLENDVNALIHLATEVNGSALGHNRIVQVPCKTLSLEEVWEATQRVAKKLDIPVGEIEVNLESKLSSTTTVKTVNVVPNIDCSKAVKLGLPTNINIDDIITEYAKNFVLPSLARSDQ